MPMISALKITFAFVIVSSSALQYNANADEGRSKHATMESSLTASATDGPTKVVPSQSSMPSHAKASKGQKELSQKITGNAIALKQADSKAVRVAGTEGKKKTHRKLVKKVKKHGQKKDSKDAHKKTTKLVKRHNKTTVEHSHKKATHATNPMEKAASGATVTSKEVVSRAPIAKARAGQAAGSAAAAPAKSTLSAPVAKARAGHAAGSAAAAPTKSTLSAPVAKARAGHAAGSAAAAPTKSTLSAPVAKARAGHAAGSATAAPMKATSSVPIAKARAKRAAGSVKAAQAKANSSVPHTKARARQAADSNTASPLSKARESLMKMASSMPTFETAPTPVSLVSKGASDNDDDILVPEGNFSAVHLPSMDVFVSKPANVLQSLTSKLDQLKTSLADKAAAHRAAVKAQKEEYDAKLEALRQNISIIGRRNWRIESEIRSLNMENSQLRRKARELKATGEELERQLSRFQENMTYVQEFLNGSLVVPEDTANKTHVLRELEEVDAADKKELAHHSALAAINGMSLLQTDGESEDEADTLNEQTLSYVAQLNTSFGDLNSEQLSSEESLKQKFEEEYAVEAERQQNALAEHEMLEGRRDAAEQLRTRLQAAVAHLERSVSNFQSRLAGLKKYVGILSRV